MARERNLSNLPRTYPLRVLFWSRVFWPETGGIQVLAAKLLLALQGRGYDFTVVTPQSDSDQPQEAQYNGIPIYRFPFQSAQSYNNIDQLVKIRQHVSQLKRAFAPDLVHIFSVGRGDFFHLTTTHVHYAPVLATLHGERLHRIARPGSPALRTLHNADWITCVSGAVLTSLHQFIPETLPRSCLVYNGLDLPSHAPQPLPIAAPRLLCLGRLVPDKGLDVALEAFASLIGRFPQARLIVAGDGPERSSLEQQAVRLGLQAVVDFVGWIPPENVPALMNASTIVVMPSRYEPFGLVALDAALMARPIVAARVGGLSEVVVHQHTGLMVESENPTGFAEAITFLLDHPHTAVQLGQTARQRALEVFSWERCVDAYDSLYQKLIDHAD